MNNPAGDSNLSIRVNIKTVDAAITEFDKIGAGLADLRTKYAKVVFAVATTKGLDEAKAARLAIREPRYATERARKAAKVPLLALGSDIDDRARYITAELMALEEPVDAQIKAQEAIQEEKRLAKVKAERERQEAIQAKINAIEQLVLQAAGKSSVEIEALTRIAADCVIDAAEYQEHFAKASGAHESTVLKLFDMLDMARSQERERARVQTELVALNKARAEQAERERVIDERERTIARQQAEEEARLAARRSEMERSQAAELTKAKEALDANKPPADLNQVADDFDSRVNAVADAAVQNVENIAGLVGGVAADVHYSDSSHLAEKILSTVDKLLVALTMVRGDSLFQQLKTATQQAVNDALTCAADDYWPLDAGPTHERNFSL